MIWKDLFMIHKISNKLLEKHVTFCCPRFTIIQLQGVHVRDDY